ncbi:MAG: ABC transporter permease [Spirochaetaceae bacterium]|nr:ABC transporter permease [Spirochaetaceae bacterium]
MKNRNWQRFFLKNTTFILFVLLFLIFGIIAPRFLSFKNLEIILSNSSYIGIIAVGMTFVLLTGGIDLSVGSTMYLSAVASGTLIAAGWPIAATISISLIIGIVMGYANALIITRLKIVPFLATLVTMTVGRGIGLLITKSVQVDFPDSITLMSTVKVFGFIPLQIFIFALVVIAAMTFLRLTKSGRQLYAVGNDPLAAERAGIRTRPLISSTYIISGFFAALGGFISITQIGRVSAGFGSGDEFDAIAAAVLGGASLMGGVGSIFPGTVLGTVMIQMIQAGLVYTAVDIYLHPIVMSLIIFFAVLLDSVRTGQLKKMERRTIMKITS